MKWIEEKTYMECPNCHNIWHYEENQAERFQFCPTCGAEMQEEGYKDCFQPYSSQQNHNEEVAKAFQLGISFDFINNLKTNDCKKVRDNMKELTTYQIYLILLGYLTEQNDDTEMLESVLSELYKRANKIESEE